MGGMVSLTEATVGAKLVHILGKHTVMARRGPVMPRIAGS